MPTEAGQFVAGIIKSNRLGRYEPISGVESAMERVDARLSERVRQRESTQQYLPALVAKHGQIEEDFLAFFPELQHFVETRFRAV